MDDLYPSKTVNRSLQESIPFIKGRTFYAHSTGRSDQSDWQPLNEHLLNVGELAQNFANGFGAGGLAMAAGRLHDLGKYTQKFQQRLCGNAGRVDHSTHGAKVAIERFGDIGQLLAYGIAGHHAGLANGTGTGERTSLADRLAALDLPTLDAVWEREINLPARLNPPGDFKLYGDTNQQKKARHPFQLAFLTRMLFSCLVDADFLDTDRFYNTAEKLPNLRDAKPASTLADLRKQLDHYLGQFASGGTVNQIRAHVLRHVRAQVAQAPGLFSLTVPTGGGKTLTSLAFALDHAIQHGLQRVIFVIPFTSIVEQNAAVFRQALGPLGHAAVLEHHSAFVQQPPKDDPEKYQAQEKLHLAMENWDAPIVVTTAVQFFESLFAARPSQCRKLHNIASSVVVLDEAQTMPLKVLRPCVAAIDELARNYRTSIVLCTATQPVLKAPDFEGGLTGVRELAPEPARLFDQLKRVQVRHIGTVNDDQLIAMMRERTRVLCIVNNRRHARAIYQATADMPGARHLTTLMCAKHRSAVLADVRQLLKNNEPCRLVSTSLIEAGVDVDFPTVLRAEAGLDSIAQAAGRCNREGRASPQDSELLIFAPQNDDWEPPTELLQYAQAAREVLRQVKDDPLSPEAIRKYFAQLYWQKGSRELDVHDLLGLLRDSKASTLPMETLAAKFRMIDDTQMPVIVPYDDYAKSLLKRLEFSEGCGGLARQLQPYIVPVPRQGFDALYKAGAVNPVAPEKWENQFMMLAHEGLYNPRFGLSWDEPSLIRTEDLNW
ncbi:CRISPR-associated endonuclease Cas3'' [Castellaniella sp. UC4442_H9]